MGISQFIGLLVSGAQGVFGGSWAHVLYEFR